MRALSPGPKTPTHLGGQPDVVVPHEPRVGVVLDVLALDVMFQVEEGFSWPAGHLHHAHLHDVHLGTDVSETGRSGSATCWQPQYLLGRPVAVVLLPPQLGLHL